MPNDYIISSRLQFLGQAEIQLGCVQAQAYIRRPDVNAWFIPARPSEGGEVISNGFDRTSEFYRSR